MRRERPRDGAPGLRRKTEKALDRIYAGPPAGFIKGRDALAKDLRAEGSEEAELVKVLRKPSKAAAVVNALALDDPKPVKRYLGLAEKLRKATSGKVDAKRMRELAREEGELLEELVANAGKLGDGASASTLDRVRETLQAAQVDGELAAQVLAGRVEREERAASVGLENLASPPQASGKRAKTKAKVQGRLCREGSKAEARDRGQGRPQGREGRGEGRRARSCPRGRRARQGGADARRRRGTGRASGEEADGLGLGAAGRQLTGSLSSQFLSLSVPASKVTESFPSPQSMTSLTPSSALISSLSSPPKIFSFSPARLESA